MIMIDFNKVFSFCWFANILCIREEVEKYLEGYSLQGVEKQKGEYNCSFRDENDNSITLTIQRDRIGLYVYMKNSIDRILIDENLVLTHKSIVRREKGFLYSIVKKQFSLSEFFSNKVGLVDISEERFVFKNKTIAFLLNQNEIDDFRLEKLLLKIMLMGYRIDLSKKADCFSEYSASLEYKRNKEAEEEFARFVIKIYVNGEDVSYLYKNLKGENIISRVHNLYVGKIKRKDIDAIRNRALTINAANLKLYKGITGKENEILGGYCFNDSQMQLDVTRDEKKRF